MALSVSLIVPSGPTAPEPQDTAPAQRAYCSLPDQRADLLATAESLGLPSPAPVFEHWRDTRTTDFDQACTTLIAARALTQPKPVTPAAAKSSAPTPNYLSLFFSAIVGALLALLGGEWKSRRDRHFAVALALRAAGTSFAKEGNAVIRALNAPMARPDPGVFLAARDELVNRLHESAALKETGLGRALAGDLVSGKAERVVQGWPSNDTSARTVRSNEAKAWLSAVGTDIHRLAAAMQQPWPGSPTASTATDQPVGS